MNIAKLATYASTTENSRGRLHNEPDAIGRSIYQRDRDRIIHSSAFRRLEYKTQVFVYHEGDHYRTRLTHSLEVAQLARSTARELFLNEDLAEAISLAHDFGHTPFGHAGEEALREVMAEFGSFDHNGQSLRVITKLESKYADFDGLNLTWETLEGIAKHNGPVTQNIPRAISEYNVEHNLELDIYPSIEAQLASLSDDIAYNNHDIDDGLRAGMFTVNDLKNIPLVGGVFCELKKRYTDIEEMRLIHEAKRRIINIMVRDLVQETCANIDNFDVKTSDDIRNLGKPVVSFSKEMQAKNIAIKEFLLENMYRHYKVNRMTSKAKVVVKELFEYFKDEPHCLPTSWRTQVKESKNKCDAAIIIADFIAGMTDRFAVEEHKRIFDPSHKLIGE